MGRNIILKQWYTLGIISLFIGTTVIPLSGQTIEKSALPMLSGKWFYVGGSGPGNYTRIRDAINDSTNGDTVFVYDESSPYYQNILIDKSIRVIGEDKNTTTIIGTGDYDGSVLIIANKAFFGGFTIEQQANAYGIWIKGNENIITENIIDNYYYGIYIESFYPSYSTKNMIFNNLIKNCFIGLELYHSSDNVITDNIFNNCEMDNRYGGGISIAQGDNTVISDNDIRFCGVGIYVEDSDSVSIFLNNVEKNAMGISTSSANNIEITQNNIHLNRERNIVFREYIRQNMYIDNNYWGILKLFPKKILGLQLIYLFTLHLDEWNPPFGDWPIYLPLPKIYVDKNPAQKPYDIPGIR
jgi:parallel beta-helix repeat protein